MAQKAVLVAVATVSLAAVDRAEASSPRHMELANGLSVTIYDAEYLTDRLTTLAGDPAIQLDDGRYLPVITDINDPSIYNKGDGQFHPFTDALVSESLREIDHPSLRLSVRVYLLPYPRRNLLVSATSGKDVFLSPHVLDIDPAVAAYIVTHEIGHVFHNRYMPDGSAAWGEYRRIRGIDDARFSDTASHAYRPKEIFAEDFRVLFGGSDARTDGRVENIEVASPGSVSGLENFFVRVARGTAERGPAIAATSYPNPFNPDTEIRVTMPSELADMAEPVSVKIYAVNGALVRDLYAGRASGDFVVRWDGTDRAGNPVASSTYYAAVQVGDARETVKLLLLK
ncbi:MAG TPA: FlgD immunoglobulin-like domain containing protein [Candidatus Krumholzibacteria bacterium]|nr:FlgD immunoglobulin-like domain containing protein [Candidatus Krumholzibacteria bacterium]